MLLPALAKAKAKAQQINCVNNLKQVGVSFRIWGNDNGDRYPMRVPVGEGGPFNQAAIAALNATGNSPYTYQVFQVMSNELGTPKIVICPSDGDRTAATNFGGHFSNLGNVAVSYFVGKDADESNPQQYLSGDRNIGLGATWNGSAAPAGVTGYSPNAANTGYYVSLAANQNNANLKWTDKLHQAKGNICLSDGSVQQYTSAKMRTGITNATDAMWIMFP